MAYKLYNNTKDRLREALHPFRKKYHRDFYALREIDLDVRKGEILGVVGKNGSGKSTLLKIVSNIMQSTSGSVQVNGTVSAILELGGGFNPDFTGIENVYFYGSIQGYGKKEMNERLGGIIEFADIGEFVYQPIKTYSSGMLARLAFAVSTAIAPGNPYTGRNPGSRRRSFQKEVLCKDGKVNGERKDNLLCFSFDRFNKSDVHQSYPDG